MGNVNVKRKSIPKKVRLQVYEKCNHRCAYCGNELEYKNMQVDHVESLYWHGGVDEIENYLPACRVCNFYKSTMGIEKFRHQLQTLTERLQKIFIYRLACKYGIVEERHEPIVFYFETLKIKE